VNGIYAAEEPGGKSVGRVASSTAARRWTKTFPRARGRGPRQAVSHGKRQIRCSARPHLSVQDCVADRQAHQRRCGTTKPVRTSTQSFVWHLQTVAAQPGPGCALARTSAGRHTVVLNEAAPDVHGLAHRRDPHGSTDDLRRSGRARLADQPAHAVEFGCLDSSAQRHQPTCCKSIQYYCACVASEAIS